MASGTHKVWPPILLKDPNNPFKPISVLQEMHLYPRSRGRVLRHIGADLEEAAEIVTERARTTTAVQPRDD